jgi:hypothetical protein
MLLALAGGALGIALARSSLDALVAFAPPALLGGQELTIDARVLLVRGRIVGADRAGRRACALAIVGRRLLWSRCTPAARASRIRRASGSLLVVGQVAMTVVLLCGGGAACANGDRTHQRESRL